MSVEFKDNSDAWARAIVESCNEGLTVTAARLADAFRDNMGTEGGRAIGRVRTVSGTKRRKFKAFKKGETNANTTESDRLVWQAAPPGKFPGKRSGAMARSMQSTKSVNLVAYAGSTMSGKDNYPLFLETGWERRKPLSDKQLRMLHAMRREMQDAGIATINNGGTGGGKVYARPWLHRTVREKRAELDDLFVKVASAELARRTAQ